MSYSAFCCVSYDNIKGSVYFINFYLLFQLNFLPYFHMGLFLLQLCTQHAPKSIYIPDIYLLWSLPPILSRAYNTMYGTPARDNVIAAPIPAAPEPIIIT